MVQKGELPTTCQWHEKKLPQIIGSCY